MYPDAELLELAHRLLYRPGRVAELCVGPGGPRDWLPKLRKEEAPADLPSAASLALHASLCRGLDIRCATWGSSGYPRALAVLREPPPLIFFRGRLPLPGDTPLGVVGSRRASRAGLEMARRLGRAAAAAGHPVVSGLARGIDQAAQRGSLEEGETWGVLGCGLDQVYPPEAGQLALDVVAHGGLISEFPPGCPPLPFHFPRRNRIIAALAQGLLVVEAGLRSGALRTAQECRDLGRELGAVPGSPVNPSAAGSNQLLAEGCQLILGPEDLPLLWGEDREALAASAGEWTPERCGREGVDRVELLSARSGCLLTEALVAVANWERQGRVERLSGGSFRVLACSPDAKIAKGEGAG